MASDRWCAVSVDLDEVDQYFSIHGGSMPRRINAHAVYELAVPRFVELAAAENLPLTFFAVGRDLRRPQSAAVLRRALEQGHEVANHSLNHRYDLTRLSQSEITREVRGGIEAIEEACGVTPGGFRAPGYTFTDTLKDVLEAAGARYDSSVFPCPFYYAGKATLLGAKRLWGRRTATILDAPAVLRAPRLPYRMATPYWLPGGTLPEVPIAVTPRARLPYIGTALTLAGRLGARWLTRRMLEEPLINLELHGIDLLESADGLAPLAGAQLDLNLSLAAKTTVLRATLRQIRAAGYRFLPLAHVAEHWPFE